MRETAPTSSNQKDERRDVDCRRREEETSPQLGAILLPPATKRGESTAADSSRSSRSILSASSTSTRLQLYSTQRNVSDEFYTLWPHVLITRYRSSADIPMSGQNHSHGHGALPGSTSLAFFSSASAPQWAFLLSQYKDILRLHAHKSRGFRKNGPEELIKLDNW